MVFRPVKPQTVAEAVSAEIEDLLLAGLLAPGDPLPPERALAEKLGVSRSSLRDALGVLVERGLVEKKPGSGVFISELIAASLVDPLSALIGTRPEALDDYIAFRRLIEGDAAAQAAQLGAAADRERLTDLRHQLCAAHEADDPALESVLDARLHAAIVEAADNAVTLLVTRSLSRALERGMAETRNRIYDRTGVRDAILEQHCALIDAILSGDPAAARAASDRHLDFVSQALAEGRMAERRETRAARRFDSAEHAG